MAIIKRGNKWRARVRDPGGRWWSQTCSSKAAAQAAERDMLDCRDRGVPWVHPRDRVGSLTCRAVAEAFITAKRAKLRAKTLRRYARELEDFVSWSEDRRRPLMAQLRRIDLRVYYERLVEAGRWGHERKPQTANKIINTVMMWWAWAKEYDDEYGWEGQVPSPRRIELPKVSAPVTVAPTWSEMDDLISELEDVEWCRRAAWLQRFTALRISEALSLRWERVDVQSRVLIVDAELSKGGYSGRSLPIAEALAAEMSTWPRSGPWVCGDTAQRVMDTSRPSRVYRNAWTRAAVRAIAWEGQPTHALRKGVISGLHQLGAAPDAVEVLAGHSLGVRGHYLDHQIAFDLKGLVERIPAVGVVE